MGIIVGRVEPFINGRDPDEPLGTRLRGRFAELEVDAELVTFDAEALDHVGHTPEDVLEELDDRS